MKSNNTKDKKRIYLIFPKTGQNYIMIFTFPLQSPQFSMDKPLIKSMETKLSISCYAAILLWGLLCYTLPHIMVLPVPWPLHHQALMIELGTGTLYLYYVQKYVCLN